MKKYLCLGTISLALLSGAWSGSAANFTWTGGATGSNLNDFDAKQNWQPLPVGSPVSGDDLLFTSVTAGGSTTPTLENAASVKSILFDANAASFTFAGANPLNVETGIINDSQASQTFNVEVAGSGGVLQNSGTLNLSGPNSYTGSTAINGGILNANSTSAFGSSSGIELNGGVLNLNADVSAALTPLTLGGGTLNQNTSDSSFGPLILGGGNSIINLGLTGSLTFNGDASWQGGTLTITGWTGTTDSAQVFITGTLSPDFLSHITFAGFDSVTVLPNGELVAVPEPALYALVFGVGLLGFALARRRGHAPAAA